VALAARLARVGAAGSVRRALGAVGGILFIALALRLLPGDILEDAIAQCQITSRNEDAVDPDSARLRLFDLFAQVADQTSLQLRGWAEAARRASAGVACVGARSGLIAAPPRRAAR
jgi:hypothetical protein